MNEQLVKTECYICMESCEYKSPCTCATHVHPDCLIAYLKTSGHTHCTICLSEYPIPPPPKPCIPRPHNPCNDYRCIIYMTMITVLFLFGWVGSVIFEQDYDPVSPTSFVSAILGTILIFIVYKIVEGIYRILRYRILR